MTEDVIYCKDCEHCNVFEVESLFRKGKYLTFQKCTQSELDVTDYDYCSRAERKSNEHNL